MFKSFTEIQTDIAERLGAAVKNRNLPMHSPVVATADADARGEARAAEAAAGAEPGVLAEDRRREEIHGARQDAGNEQEGEVRGASGDASGLATGRLNVVFYLQGTMLQSMMSPNECCV